MRSTASREAQRGVALMLLLVIAVLGVGWYAISALSKVPVSLAEREELTGKALMAAKEAVLAHVAQSAASSTELYPGRLPCPEVRSQAGTANDGIAGPFSAPAIACDGVGRLPWKTLGVDQIRDGYGEPLWYAVPTGTWAWLNTGDALTINPGLANQISYDGAANAVVAVIIAPGPPMNTLNEPLATKPAACATVNQTTNRYGTPYDVANFLECGNAVGSYTTIGPSTIDPGPPQRTVVWSNDRTISITAAEVMHAIAGAVADRLQRQVAPALSDWRSAQSVANWGVSFLPYASTFTTPATNDLCGNFGVQEGLMPTNSAPICNTNWTSGSVSPLLGLLNFGCALQPTYMECTFLNLFSAPPFAARITATAPNVANSFRRSIAGADVVVTGGTGGSATVVSNSVSPVTGNGTTIVDASWSLVSFLAVVRVRINYLQDAPVASDARMTWFRNNGWPRYTYYAVSNGAKLGAASTCAGTGDPDCLTVSGLPASNGNTDDKQFVLTLMGPAVPGQTQPSANPTDYLETHTVGSASFTTTAASSTSNDRHASCPFQQTPQSGGPVTVCN